MRVVLCYVLYCVILPFLSGLRQIVYFSCVYSCLIDSSWMAILLVTILIHIRAVESYAGYTHGLSVGIYDFIS